MRKWLLPEYIEDILPEPARRIEALRRAMLDLFALHGYQLVLPPLLEYVESLLTGTGHDLDLKTFKLVDQLSGRMLGVRADITPQVARIDAHLMNRKGVNRLCYAGSVLHTLPAGLNRTREPLQIGAEIYGHAGIESDLEVQRLMLDALRLAGIAQLQLDIGHVAVFRTLVRKAGVEAEAEAELFRAVQAKDVPALAQAGAQARPQARRGVAGAARACRRHRGAGARQTAVAGLQRNQAGACAIARDRRVDAGHRHGDLLRSRRAARPALSQRRGVRRVCRGLVERARARRALRRGRQGVRPGAAGDRLQHGFARDRGGRAGGGNARTRCSRPICRRMPRCSGASPCCAKRARS